MSLPRGAGSFHFIYFTTIIALAKLLYFVPFHLSGQAARHYQPPGYTGITDVQPHKIAARVHAEACINLRRHRTTQRDLERKPELAIGAPCVDRRRGYDYRTRQIMEPPFFTSTTANSNERRDLKIATNCPADPLAVFTSRIGSSTTARGPLRVRTAVSRDGPHILDLIEKTDATCADGGASTATRPLCDMRELVLLGLA